MPPAKSRKATRKATIAFPAAPKDCSLIKASVVTPMTTMLPPSFANQLVPRASSSAEIAFMRSLIVGFGAEARRGENECGVETRVGAGGTAGGGGGIAGLAGLGGIVCGMTTFGGAGGVGLATGGGACAAGASGFGSSGGAGARGFSGGAATGAAGGRTGGATVTGGTGASDGGFRSGGGPGFFSATGKEAGGSGFAVGGPSIRGEVTRVGSASASGWALGTGV